MAVHCDVCGTRIMEARENEGQFDTPEAFISRAPSGKHPKNDEIHDTCDYCGPWIRKEIRLTVERVVKEIREKIDG